MNLKKLRKTIKEHLVQKVKRHKALLLPIFRFLVLTLAPRRPFWVYQLAWAEGELKRYREALTLFELALTRAGTSPRQRLKLLVRRHRCHKRMGCPDKAADDLRQALVLAPGNFYCHERLIALLKKAANWQWVEAAKAYAALRPRKTGPLAELGAACYAMGRFGEAAEAFEAALVTAPDDEECLYQAGRSHERAGRPAEAQSKYTALLALPSFAPEESRLGPGLAHERRKNWAAAAEAYAVTLARTTDLELADLIRLRLGEAYARRRRWAEAAEVYRAAFERIPGETVPEKYQQYAVALERAGRLEEAMVVYRRLAEVTTWKDPWYRLGCVLHDLGQPQEAVKAFFNCLDGASVSPGIVMSKAQVTAAEKELSRDQSNAETHYKLGCYYETLSDWEKAAQAHQQAVDRREKHESKYYYRLGVALSHEGRFDEAVAAFRGTRRVYKTASLARAPKGDFFNKTMGYLAAWENCPVREKVILYESFHGRTMTDNPYALFRYLLDNPAYAGWLHVWALNDKKLMPEEYLKRPNVVFAKRNSHLYYRYLATAGWLVNNVTFMPEFIRRPKQKYLNTWHGTPLKTMGKDVVGDFLPHANIARNFLQATHLINPSEYTRDILLKTAEVDEIVAARQALTGYPRIDRMLQSSEQEKATLRCKLGLKDDGRPVVLYAPTWRAEAGQDRNVKFDLKRTLKTLKSLNQLNVQIIFRGHHLAAELIKIKKLPVIISYFSHDTSEVLAITDILITDYSSIFFDFLPARKPILFYAYDLEDYYARRGGLYFPLEDMPGAICRTDEELTATLERTLRGEYTPDQKHLAVLAKFCPYEDSRASERTEAFFFQNTPAEAQAPAQRRQPVLFFEGPFIPNGITASFLNLSRALDRTQYCPVLAVDSAKELEKYPERRAKFEEFEREGAQLVTRCGRRLFTLEEKLAEDLFNREPEYSASSEITRLRRQNAVREFKRVFGYGRYQAIVNFEGYSWFWAEMLAYAPISARRLIYLHNDMTEEYKVRFPYLEKVFQTYGLYDALACVSPSCRESNLCNLASRFNLEQSKFVAVRNLINEADIIAKAAVPIPDDLADFIDSSVLFLALGRLSPEKDHEKLIKAFSAICEGFPQAKLLILGEGPLRQFLETLIHELGLRDRVKLGGFRENPYPVLQRADCLVQSSNHEGQPMVFLEAMVLQKSIISTDIPPARYVLENNYGLLVENTQAALETGLKTFLGEGLLVKPFDAAIYNRGCLAEFEKLVNRDA